MSKPIWESIIVGRDGRPTYAHDVPLGTEKRDYRLRLWVNWQGPDGRARWELPRPEIYKMAGPAMTATEVKAGAAKATSPHMWGQFLEANPAKPPDDSAARKATPIATGCLDYFPLALTEVARLSKAGNDKHNPGEPLHWSRHKSSDHADCILRHMVDRGKVDPEDGFLHDVKVAWRALAQLEIALERRRHTGAK